jgi:hypothetical protein
MEYLDIAAERLRSDSLRFYSALLLPYVYQDTDDIEAWRKSFKKNLRALAKRGLVISDPFSMEGVPQATARTIATLMHAPPNLLQSPHAVLAFFWVGGGGEKDSFVFDGRRCRL